jgi:hypothetical protein
MHHIYELLVTRVLFPKVFLGRFADRLLFRLVPGKHNLVVLNKSFDEILAEVAKRLGDVVNIGGVSGALTHFVIEEFLPHEEEYYISVTSTREGTVP